MRQCCPRTSGHSRQAAPKGRLCLIGLLLAVSTHVAAVEGAIVATVTPVDQVRSVCAVDRQAGQRFAGSVDPATGKLIIGGLPVDAAYDCVIDYLDPTSGQPARLEGVGMKAPPSDYIEEQPLSIEDVAAIQGKIRNMNQFEDVVEILGINGNIQHAAVVLNKLRTRPFHASKPGEVIWRLELWHYERPEETWLKVQDEMFLVLYRERIQRRVYDEKALSLDPTVGGLRLTADAPKVDLGRVTLPQARRGIRMRSEEKNEAKNTPGP